MHARATYEAFAMVSASMAIQHAKWLQHARELAWRAPLASLNVLLTSTCWRNDHNGFSHQGPGLMDTMISLSGEVVRARRSSSRSRWTCLRPSWLTRRHRLPPPPSATPPYGDGAKI